MPESGTAAPAASRCAVAPKFDAITFAAKLPIASTSGDALASMKTTVLGVTRKLSGGESVMDAGIGITACEIGRPAGGGACFAGEGDVVVVVTLGRHAATRVVASKSVQMLTAVVRLRLTVIDYSRWSTFMRKFALLVSFALVATGTTVHAQGRGMGRASGRGGPGGPAMMMDRLLFKDITLTDAQKAKLEELRKAERDQMQAQVGRGGGASDFEAIREAREKGDTATVRRLMADQRDKMEARRNERITALRAILTSDQVAQFDANVEEMKKRQAEMPMGRRGGPPTKP